MRRDVFTRARRRDGSFGFFFFYFIFSFRVVQVMVCHVPLIIIRFGQRRCTRTVNTTTARDVQNNKLYSLRHPLPTASLVAAAAATAACRAVYDVQ